jgi:magnesium transporter
MARTRVYRNGVLDQSDVPLADVSDYLAQPDTVVWIDVCDPDHHELEAVSDELQLHDLAIEDALHEHERPKLDRYQTHLFATAYQVRLDHDTGELNLAEVSAFITQRALVTVRKSQDFDIDEVLRRWDDSPDLAKFGTAFLLHGLIDYVVDTHFEAVHALDDKLELLEDLLFDESTRGTQVQRQSFELRKSLVLLRRVVLPMREVVNALMRRDLHVVDEAMVPYFQDVYDHVLRATEWTESLRDLVTTILETYLTIQGNRLNSIMKKVTSWAAIIAVPTAVTGFYGQNIPYPGFSQPSGLWMSSGAIVLFSGLLYLIFRRRDWI